MGSALTSALVLSSRALGRDRWSPTTPVVPGLAGLPPFLPLSSGKHSGPSLLMPPLSLMLGIKRPLVAVLTGRACPWNGGGR